VGQPRAAVAVGRVDLGQRRRGCGGYGSGRPQAAAAAGWVDLERWALTQRLQWLRVSLERRRRLRVGLERRRRQIDPEQCGDGTLTPN
jgi:hypothetical protein